MSDYLGLLGLVVPVFAIMGAGLFARRMCWMSGEAEQSLLRLIVNLLYPCLIFESVLGNEALRQPANILVPPLVGFFTVVLGYIVAYYAARALGFVQGKGLRTFAFAVGIYNYGYIPIPLVTALFGRETLGVLFIHNVGTEIAIWTVGILLLTGTPLREGWRKLINPPVISIVLAIGGNFAGVGEHLPEALMTAIRALAACAIPLGLLLIGSTMNEFVAKPGAIFHAKTLGASGLLRLGALPLLFLLAARYFPFSPELKAVMVVQAAMPAAVLPIMLAKHYEGHPITAVRVAVGTTLAGLLIIPLWIRFGIAFVGL